MLEPFIIEEILRREREQAEERARPALHIHIEPPRPEEFYYEESPEETADRGVVIIDLMG